MTIPSWKSDVHGTLVLPGDLLGAPDGFAWLQGRQHYCDRGHWDWGTQGIAVHALKEAAPMPAHYFMHLENGRLEIEAWLARGLGAAHSGRTIETLSEGDIDFQAPNTKGEGWSWERDGNTLHAMIEREEQKVQATITQQDTPSGPVFVFDVQSGIPTLDDADCFPRSYMDLDRALDEAENFFSWRLLKVPTQSPYRFENTEIPLSTPLSGLVSSAPARSTRMRP